jgi:DNA ligase (NAD+)
MEMTKEQLYNNAKEAYYNGQPIMSDIEFDELESDLGLENKGYIGTRHNPSYTIKHPFIMGSLSKVQIKEDEQGNVDWIKYSQEIEKYIFKNGQHHLIITPKYDGCSYECVVTNGKVESVSSRGDGEYGKDLYNHLINHVQPIADSLIEQLLSDNFVFRGEVLVSKKLFEEKYSEFVNPRSFVAGLLNRDYEANDTELKEMLSDLSLAVFDIRINEEGNLIDIDCDELNIPNFNKDVYILYTDGNQRIDFKNCLPNIYNTFSELRNNIDFALDGFVIKPVAQYRESLLTEVRPSDCVAVKFIPMLEETVVEEIIWNTGKTNEMIPVIKVKPVTMDGKQVSRASAHNYGYVKDNRISVGTKVILSLAGDIIPFIYKVTDTTSFSLAKLNLPIPEFEGQYTVSGCHLYKQLSEVEQKHKNFKNSALSLNIPGLGGSSIDKIFEYIKEAYKGDEFFGIEERPLPDNILCIKDVDIERALGGKTGANIKKEFNNLLINLTLKDIIRSLNIEDCGERVSEEIEKYLLCEDYDFSHLPEKAYKWSLNICNSTYARFLNVLNSLNKRIEDFKVIHIESSKASVNQIPVILTGEPNNYTSKAEFLKCHPEYKLTGSWKEVQIVFTNSLESKTGKMKKAIEKNIKIELY